MKEEKVQKGRFTFFYDRRRVVFLAIALVFIASLTMFIIRLVGYYTDSMTYKKVAEQIPPENPEDFFNRTENSVEAAQLRPTAPDTIAGTILGNEPVPVDLPYISIPGNPLDINESGILRNYENLKKENSDLFGWIKVPGFKKPVSYPVMYTADETCYLTKDFYKNDSYAGSIFFDGRNNPGQVDRHIILYGHAMKDMAMFGFFSDYPQNSEDLNNVTKIYLDLLDTRLEYEIFSTYYAEADDQYRITDFASDEEFLAFISGIKAKSAYNFGDINLSAYDKILTLSTCSSRLFEDGRTVVHARLKRVIRYNQASTVENTAQSESTGQENPVSANVYISSLNVSYELVVDGVSEPSSSPSEGLPDPDLNLPDHGLDIITSPAPASNLEVSATPIPSATPVPEIICELDPHFNTALKEFKTTVPEEADTVILSVVPSDPKSVVELILNDQKLETDNIPLEYGENAVKIRVISRDGQYARYTVLIITRTAPPGMEPSPSVSPEPTSSDTPQASPGQEPISTDVP